MFRHLNRDAEIFKIIIYTACTIGVTLRKLLTMLTRRARRVRTMYMLFSINVQDLAQGDMVNSFILLIIGRCEVFP